MPEATLRRVVEAGRLTGSAKNDQPWQFVVVQEREHAPAARPLARTGAHIAQAAAAVVVAGGAEPVRGLGCEPRDPVHAAGGVGGRGGRQLGRASAVWMRSGRSWASRPSLDVLAILPLGYPAGVDRPRQEATEAARRPWPTASATAGPSSRATGRARAGRRTHPRGTPRHRRGRAGLSLGGRSGRHPLHDRDRERAGALPADGAEHARLGRRSAARRAAGGRPGAGTTIPFTPGAPILVSARINGGGAITLVLDTGAERTLVAPAALARLGIALPNTLEATIQGVAGTIQADVVSIQSLEVGNSAAAGRSRSSPTTRSFRAPTACWGGTSCRSSR